MSCWFYGHHKSNPVQQLPPNFIKFVNVAILLITNFSQTIFILSLLNFQALLKYPDLFQAHLRLD